MLLSSTLLRALWVAALTLFVSGLSASGEPVDPAQAIAQKFSEDDSAPPQAPKPPPAKTVPIAAASARSAANPEPVKAPIVKAAAANKEAVKAEPAKSEPVKAAVAEPNPEVAKPEPVRLEPARVELPGADYETDMLARAREEELERQAEEARDAARAILAPIKVAGPVEAAAPVAAPDAAPLPVPSAPEPAAPAASAPPVTAAPPEAQPPPVTTAAPATLLASPVEPKPGPAKAEQAAANPPPPPATPPVIADTGASPATSTRATVLLVLELDDRDGASVKPDPIICFDQKCWLSNGLEAPAHPMPRSQAIALKTTDNVTSDSCAGMSGCAYRNIELAPDAQVQVVEVGESRGVSDGSFSIVADKSCRKDGSTLVCGNGLATQSFRMWVVPEATAQAAGAEALENAVADGLDGEDAQSANDK